MRGRRPEARRRARPRRRAFRDRRERNATIGSCAARAASTSSRSSRVSRRKAIASARRRARSGARRARARRSSGAGRSSARNSSRNARSQRLGLAPGHRPARVLAPRALEPELVAGEDHRHAGQSSSAGRRRRGGARARRRSCGSARCRGCRAGPGVQHRSPTGRRRGTRCIAATASGAVELRHADGNAPELLLLLGCGSSRSSQVQTGRRKPE